MFSRALESICSVSENDGVTFDLGTISPIHIYGGYRVSFNARFETILTPLTIDIFTGDVITPNAVRFTFSEIFDEHKSFGLWAYNIETVLAEKMETILRRGVFNTRPRDFNDTYILATTQKYDPTVFKEALKGTAEHRGTAEQIADVKVYCKTSAKAKSCGLCGKSIRAVWVREGN